MKAGANDFVPKTCPVPSFWKGHVTFFVMIALIVMPHFKAC